MIKVGQVLICKNAEFNFEVKLLVVEMRIKRYNLINLPSGVSYLYWDCCKRTLKELEDCINEEFEIKEIEELEV